jgi:formate dehydrogenase
VSSGGRARLRTAAGEADVLVEVTEDITPGTVSYPHGYGHEGGSWQEANAIGGVNVNRLTPGTVESLDPLSGASHLDAVPAWLEV